MITCSYLTLSGSAYGEPARYTLLERAKAAHAWGISSIGVNLDEEIDEAALKYVTIPEAEWVDLYKVPSTEDRYRLAAFRNVLGVTRVNAGVTSKHSHPDLAARNLSRLLEITGPLGITVAVEPVAFGAISTIGQVDKMLTDAGALQGAGLLYDWWQTSYDPQNLFANPEAILPVIAEVQLCGFRTDDPDTDDPAVTSQDREFLADCSLRNIRWLRNELAMMAPGVPFSYELPSALLRRLTLMEAAEMAALDMSILEG